MDRRAAFFLVAALVCGLLAFPCDADLRWVPISLGLLYLVLALLSALDAWSQHHASTRADEKGAGSGDPDQPNRPVM